ncbi:MAG: TlpA family protein disulfide reductase [Alphaproteobacteria bacterium]|nr:TlpA family protein disulfide reductase [Alphaproteobacteria bacterium]
MEEVAWLDPPQALQRSRALRGKARTAALLIPDPARLAARALPPDFCVPTLRARCETERAVAFLAADRVGAPRPDLAEVKDRGAQRAADRWLERLDQLWFARGAGLARASRDGGATTLAEVLAAETGLRVGRPAPDWTAGSVRGVDLRGKVIVLTFWASWCRKCLAQLPLVDAQAARWAAEGLPVRVLAVSVDDDEEAYRRALGRLAWGTMTMVRDDHLRRPFRADDLPTTVVIDGGGVVRDHRAGYPEPSWLDEAVRPWVALSSRGPGG